MLKIVVCDDDKVYLTEVTALLETYFKENGLDVSLAVCSSAAELLQMCGENEKPDLCFLDIELGEENGIEAAKELNQLCPSCDIAFLTNYISYATDAYETEHFYYVLKEELPDRLEKIIKRYYKENHFLAIHTARKEWLFDEREIVYMERGRRYCRIKTLDGTVSKLSVPFEEVAGRLEGPDFLRCHNSFMVNLRNMSSYRTEAFLMKDGTEIPVSRRYRDICLERFLKWQEVWI